MTRHRLHSQRVVSWVFGLSVCFVYQPQVSAETPVTGTKGLTPLELDLAADQTPAFTFVNKTGAAICDFTVSMVVGAGNITGALLDDPTSAAEDWDVDGDRSGTLDAPGGVAENSAAPGAEGVGAAALSHADNTQAANRQIRIEEAGMNNCVERNRNFEISLAFDIVPTAGDKIRIQPTNARGRNLYAWDGGLDREQSFAMLATRQLKPTFAAVGYQDEVLVTALKLTTLTYGISFVDIITSPAGKVDLDSGMVYFDKPVDGANGVMVEGTTSDFGVVSVSARTTNKPEAKRMDY